MLTKKVSQTRRRLLKIACYGLLAGTPGLTFGHSAKRAGTATSPISLTPLTDSMRAIGEAYLNKYPGERSKSALLGAIQSRSGMVDLTTGGPAPAAVRRLITEDFSADNVVYLDGWVLSRTEARFAALTVVKSSRQPTGCRT